MKLSSTELRSAKEVAEVVSQIVGNSNLFRTEHGIKVFAQIAIEITRGTLRSKPEVLRAMCFWGLDKSEQRLYRIFQLDSIVISFVPFSLYTENHQLLVNFKDRNIPCGSLGQLLGRLMIESEEIPLNIPIASYIEDEIQRYWEIMQSRTDHPLRKQPVLDRILDYGLRLALSKLEQDEE